MVFVYNSILNQIHYEKKILEHFSGVALSEQHLTHPGPPSLSSSPHHYSTAFSHPFLKKSKRIFPGVYVALLAGNVAVLDVVRSWF